MKANGWQPQCDVAFGSLASDLTCQRHVRLDRDLGHAGGTGEEFRAGIQRSVDKGWLVRHESGTYVKPGGRRTICLRRPRIKRLE
jgi:hypothetical protein